MYLKITRPIAVFDLETTGTNAITDRIVEVAIIKIMPNQTRLEKNLRINPQVPIPEEVSKIHGIYNKDVRHAPTFKDMATELNEFLVDCDLAGYNVLRFDIPILIEEFLRAGIEFHIDNRRIIDVQKLFHLMEKRTLSAAYLYYCDKKLEEAHSAMGDTVATLEILDAQIKRYENQMAYDNLGNEMEIIKNNVQQLHTLCKSNQVDLAGRMIYNDKGEEVLNFGKHKGKKVSEVLDREPGFYDWVMRGDFALDTKRKLTQIRLRNIGNIKN